MNDCTCATTGQGYCKVHASVGDKAPQVGDTVLLSSVFDKITGMFGIQGPPGPPGPAADCSLHTGSQEKPALMIEVDGWVYSFPTIDMARHVREKLLSMTLEGEL